MKIARPVLWQSFSRDIPLTTPFVSTQPARSIPEIFGEYSLSVAIFDECSLSVAIFGECSLSVAIFGEYSLSVAIFGECSLSVAIFGECSLSVAIFGTSREHLGNTLKEKLSSKVLDGKVAFLLKVYDLIITNINLLGNSSNHKVIFPEYSRGIPPMPVSKIFQGYPWIIVKL